MDWAPVGSSVDCGPWTGSGPGEGATARQLQLFVAVWEDNSGLPMVRVCKREVRNSHFHVTTPDF